MSKKISVGATVAISVSTTIVLVLLAIVLTFQVTFVALNVKYQKALEEYQSELADNQGSLGTPPDESDVYSKLAEIDEIYRKYYIGEIDEKELSDYIMRGYIAGTGDKYAYYLSEEEFADMMSDTNAEFVGIGVNVIWSDNMIEIINVMPDSPALEAGIMPGDFVIAVEGQSVAELGYTESVNRMLGEEGTVINFTVQRDGTPLEFAITRAKISEVSVLYRIHEVDPTIGIIQILEFDLGTPAQFKEACSELLASGVTRFVFDVRNNPGGNLDAICEVLDYLLPEGPIVHIEYKSGDKRTISSDENQLDTPCVVLVNEGTASAGELFASAIKDYKRGALIGTVTYGKGTMQNILQLPDNSGFGISTALYNPPFSKNYEGIGVTPDYPCEMSEQAKKVHIYKLSDAEDTQLVKAVEVLNSSITE